MTAYDEPGASDGKGGPHPLAGVPQEALDSATDALVQGGDVNRINQLCIAQEDWEPVAHAVLMAGLEKIK